ncbi:MAG: hypothetical protein HRT99_01870, partial [Mycoplasmatales bacterium]|nr:hypothetical protein [Mycoplasmatales bacterium]
NPSVDPGGDTKPSVDPGGDTNPSVDPGGDTNPPVNPNDSTDPAAHGDNPKDEIVLTPKAYFLKLKPMQTYLKISDIEGIDNLSNPKVVFKSNDFDSNVSVYTVLGTVNGELKTFELNVNHEEKRTTPRVYDIEKIDDQAISEILKIDNSKSDSDVLLELENIPQLTTLDKEVIKKILLDNPDNWTLVKQLINYGHVSPMDSSVETTKKVWNSSGKMSNETGVNYPVKQYILMGDLVPNHIMESLGRRHYKPENFNKSDVYWIFTTNLSNKKINNSGFFSGSSTPWPKTAKSLGGNVTIYTIAKYSDWSFTWRFDV